MKLFYLLFLIGILSTTNLSAQKDCWEGLRREGLRLRAAKQYPEAINQFFAAMYCIGAPQKDLITLIKQTQNDWVKELDEAKQAALDAQADAEQLRDQAELALDKATQEKIRADGERDEAETQRQLAETAKNEAEAQRQKVQAVLDKIYFYDGKFGLAYDEETYSYGFIDKNLEVKIPFYYYEALPFGESGYARVKKYNDTLRVFRNYIIDTTGTEFMVATDIDKLNTENKALDLRDKGLKKISKKIFRNKQLEILLVSDNQLTKIPSQISKLNNLKLIDLSNNNLKSLPKSIVQMTSLKFLNLGIHEMYREHTDYLSRIMPWCRIEGFTLKRVSTWTKIDKQ